MLLLNSTSFLLDVFLPISFVSTIIILLAIILEDFKGINKRT